MVWKGHGERKIKYSTMIRVSFVMFYISQFNPYLLTQTIVDDHPNKIKVFYDSSKNKMTAATK